MSRTFCRRVRPALELLSLRAHHIRTGRIEGSAPFLLEQVPPLQARALPTEARERLLEYLRGEARTGTSDPQLARAAELGMQGGSRPSRR